MKLCAFLLHNSQPIYSRLLYVNVAGFIKTGYVNVMYFSP